MSCRFRVAAAGGSNLRAHVGTCVWRSCALPPRKPARSQPSTSSSFDWMPWSALLMQEIERFETFHLFIRAKVSLAQREPEFFARALVGPNVREALLVVDRSRDGITQACLLTLEIKD